MLAPGVGRWIYRPVRALLTPIFKLTLHPMLVGRRSIPTSGPVIVAANHRSWIDPFVIAMLSRRKMYFVAKAELFQNRLVGWFLAVVGVFPVRRGAGDRKMLTTALEILRRGECLMIFPEGTRGTEAQLGKPLAGFGSSPSALAPRLCRLLYLEPARAIASDSGCVEWWSMPRRPFAAPQVTPLAVEQTASYSIACGARSSVNGNSRARSPFNAPPVRACCRDSRAARRANWRAAEPSPVRP